ncbi:MAG TPA: hypothetical protein VF228_20495 [Iamia sp.]
MTEKAADVADALAVVSVLWALAAMWHVLAAPVSASPASQLLLAAGIAVAIAWPGAPAGLGLLALGVLATTWSEAPFLGNHWVLSAFLGLGVLAVAASTAGAGFDGTLFATRFLPLARACLLGFYVFAAFAKLNSAFFDRSVSCGVVYFHESTDSVGLSFLQAGGHAGVEWAVIVGTAAVELSIPVLLVWRRTRAVGVVVALAFHGVLALDRHHSFVDFSSLLAVLFVCFLPASSLAAAARAVRPRVPLAGRALAAVVPAGLVAGVAARELDPDLILELRWWSWQAASLLLVAVVGRHVLRTRPAPEPRILEVRPAALLLVPALVVANGLTPYLEIKTSYGWNMYANLRTVDGDSNHFVVRRTFPVGDAQEDLVRIVATDDPVLQGYADDDVLLPFRNLQARLAERPETALTYERGGRTHRVDRAADDPELVDAPPEWQQKALAFRSSDGSAPERCQTFIRPAG